MVHKHLRPQIDKEQVNTLLLLVLTYIQEDAVAILLALKTRDTLGQPGISIAKVGHGEIQRRSRLRWLVFRTWHCDGIICALADELSMFARLEQAIYQPRIFFT